MHSKPVGPYADFKEAMASPLPGGFMPIGGGAVNSLTDRDDAGALIPEDVTREIIQSIPRQSAALSLFRRVPMSRKQQRMPVLSALPSAFWVNGDTGLKQTDQLAWSNKFLTAEELAVIVPVPENVLDDVDYDLWGETRPKLEEAFGIAIDLAVFFGTDKPTSWPDSIVDGATAAGNVLQEGSVGGQDVSVDISDLMGLVEEDGFDVNGFAARTGMKSRFRGLRASTGEIIFAPSLQAETPGTLYGEPIVYVRNGGWDSAAADLIAGDFTQGIIGIRQDITFKVFTEGVITDSDGVVVLNLMQQDAAALRATMRVGFQVANPINRVETDPDARYPAGVITAAGS